MKKYILAPAAALLLLCMLAACGNKKDSDAALYLKDIRALYEAGNYNDALSRIDSLMVLFPKAFDEIKAGLALKQQARRASDQRQIAECDSLLPVFQHRIDSMKTLFTYRKAAEDEKGEFIPKALYANSITATTLRAGITEDGKMYIESTYIGGQLHNKVAVSNSSKQSAESLPVEDDGLNFRFSNMGKQYEVIRITKFHDNGLIAFICENASKPLSVTLRGKGSVSYPLGNTQKKAIVETREFSKLILARDSITVAKDKALTRIKYLDSKEAAKPAETN